MAVGTVGDRVILESERVGESAREGVIVEVIGAGEGLHYRVRWDDRHETTLYPSGGSLSIVPKMKETGSRR